MPSEPSAEAREKCRETLFAIMVTRGSVDQMLDAIIPIIERDTANRYEARIAELEAGLKWIADTPLQWTKSQNDIYWANVATAMAQSALDTLSKEP